MIYDYLFFVVPQCPCLKKRYHDRVKKVKGNLGTVRDFDDLISPQSLFHHFLGLEPSSKVRKNLEVVKKSKCVLHLFVFYFLFFIFISISLILFSRNDNQV